ncbi:MAG: type II and III secretion system protein family protein [Pyrinomonadaceae bacterium]|nr:type II and III secretion system protein family protein [Pyrinomonadaceae bacterium]
MQTRFIITRLVTTLCAALMTVSVWSSAQAQETSYTASFKNTKETVSVNVLVGQSRVINFDRDIGRFSVSNPEIAEAVLVAPNQVLVNGKAFGQVNFIAWETGGERFLVFDVFVRANLSLIDSQIRALFPKDNINLSQANGSVVISGSVKDPNTATQVQAVVEAAGFKTVNMLSSPVKNAAQVQLSVRVAEVSRNRLKDLGTSFAYQGRPGVGGYSNSGGGPSSIGDVVGGVMGGTLSNALNVFVMGGNTLAMLRALQTQGALRALAEPNIIAMDGQTASFLAGGEFPVPIVQGSGDRNNVTIVFKEYGVRLNFKPTIIDEDHIRLELEPEVSTIDFSNGVKFDGFIVPALRTRRAKTGIELRDGQSFALAGLLDNNETRTFSKVPLVGDIPILGNLFKSKSFQKNETELMFIVTAQLVKPVNRDDLPQMRGLDGIKGASPLGVEPKGEGIQGTSGFSTGDSTKQEKAQPVKPQAPQSQPKTTTPAVIVPTGAPGTPTTTVSSLTAPILSEEPPPAPAVQQAKAKTGAGQ